MNALVSLCFLCRRSTQRPMFPSSLHPLSPSQQYRFFFCFSKIQRWFLSQLINTCTNPTAYSYYLSLFRLISASCRVLLNASVRTKSTVLYTIPRPELAEEDDGPVLGPLPEAAPPLALPIALCSLMECFMLDSAANCDGAAAAAGKPT